MLAPTVIIVLGIILLPLLANFWIGAKKVGLADLRTIEPILKLKEKNTAKKVGDIIELKLKIRANPPTKPIENVLVKVYLPKGLKVKKLDENCQINTNELICRIEHIPKRKSIKLKNSFIVQNEYIVSGSPKLKKSKYSITGEGDNVLTNLDFTFDNFSRLFARPDLKDVLLVTFFYTIFGTLGALIFGLFAALLLNVPFKGRGILRGFLLFPYVSPVIAVAFTWTFLFDPSSGAVNALLTTNNVVDTPINFFGTTSVPMNFFGFTFNFPLALASVIVFEAWRYFPLAFLFILARMQSLSKDVYEAAKIDGASPLQQFWYISLPQLVGILSTLFVLRFIWTFNKFDDIFLLTGGASGTRTLTVDVYEQGFALSDLGGSSAVAITIFFILLVLVKIYFYFTPKEEGMQ